MQSWAKAVYCYEETMPILSVFFGIIVRMWHDDHPPPHIHVEYQGFEALSIYGPAN